MTKLKTKTVSGLLFFAWILLMFVGAIVEIKYDSILFYIFAVCYFVAFVSTSLSNEMKKWSQE